jgi:hypothetical protein
LPHKSNLLSISKFFNSPSPPLKLRGGKRGSYKKSIL